MYEQNKKSSGTEYLSVDTWKLAFAVGCKKTTTHWNKAHSCRKHNNFFSRGDHLDECDLLINPQTNAKPTQYNKFFEDSDHVNADASKLEQVNKFFVNLTGRISTAEAEGNFIFTDPSRLFPRVNNRVYEPEGTAWILPPIYAKQSEDYYRLVHSKCQPISIDKALTKEQIEAFMTSPR